MGATPDAGRLGHNGTGSHLRISIPAVSFPAAALVSGPGAAGRAGWYR